MQMCGERSKIIKGRKVKSENVKGKCGWTSFDILTFLRLIKLKINLKWNGRWVEAIKLHKS